MAKIVTSRQIGYIVTAPRVGYSLSIWYGDDIDEFLLTKEEYDRLLALVSDENFFEKNVPITVHTDDRIIKFNSGFVQKIELSYTVDRNEASDDR